MKNRVINLIYLITPAFAGVILFAFFVIRTNVNVYNNAMTMSTIIDMSIVNNELVHELQLERGLSVLATTMPRQQFNERLQEQRLKVNNVLGMRTRFIGENIEYIDNVSIKSALIRQSKKLLSLAEIRRLIDEVAITEKETIEFYTELNLELINTLLSTIQVESTSKISSLLNAYYNLVQGKELAGVERALLAGGITEMSSSIKNFNIHISNVSEQSVYFDSFAHLIDEKLLAFYQQAMRNQIVDKVNEYRGLVYRSNELSASERSDWFSVATQRIEIIKTVEDKFSEELKRLTEAQISQSKNILLLSLVYGFLVISLTVFLLYRLKKSFKIQRKNQNELNKFELIVAHTPNAVVITDANHLIEYTNHQFTLLTGYEATEVLGKKPSFWKSEQTDRFNYQEIEDSIANTGLWKGELLNRKKNGDLYWCSMSIFSIVTKGGSVVNYASVIEDITEAKKDQERINFLANHDELTKLPSLRLGKDRLKQAILSAERHQLTMALMIIDLDGFKQVNDTFGHAAGDAMLIAVSARIIDILRNTDTVARIGGDEFMAVLTDVKDIKAIDRVGFNLIQSIQAPLNYDGHELVVGASIGIVLSPDNGRDIQELLLKADKAMYHAKRSGKGQFCYYSDN